MISLNSAKKSNYSKVLVLVLVMSDIFLILTSFKVSQIIIGGFNNAELSNPEYASFTAFFMLSWILSAIFCNIYHLENLGRFKKILFSSLVGFFMHSIALGIYVFIISDFQFSLFHLGLSYGVFATLTVLSKFVLLKLYEYYRNLDINRKNVIIIGYTDQGRALRDFFKRNKSLAYQFIGFFDDCYSGYGVNEIKGTLKDIKSFCVREEVDEIYYTLPYDSAQIKDLNEFSDNNFIYFSIIQNANGLKRKRYISEVYGEHIPVLTYERDPLRVVFDFRKPIAFYLKTYRRMRKAYYEFNNLEKVN